MSKQYSYSNVPSVRGQRNVFDLSHNVTTTMPIGKLVPIDFVEVLPGDSFTTRQSHLTRITSAFLKPVMDNLYMDVYHFFVPHRIVFDGFEETFGENKHGHWAASDMPEIPTIVRDGGFSGLTVQPGTIGDYLGLPIANGGISASSDYELRGISLLPFRSYAMIWNEWFRDQNTQDPVNVQTGDFGSVESTMISAASVTPIASWSPTQYFGDLAPVDKFKDYFVSAVPDPQKGEAVALNAGNVIVPASQIKVTTSGNTSLVNPSVPLYGKKTGTETIPSGILLGLPSGSNPAVQKLSAYIAPDQTAYPNTGFVPTNLVADYQGASIPIGALTINQLREAFAYQRMLERSALYGSRYREYILQAFGVSNGDSRLQIPEFLGGKRMPLNVQPVSQTSAQQGSGSPLGSVGATSSTLGGSRYSKSFTEHGYVFTVACLRYKHTYQQGIDVKWTRKTRDDFYDPVFNHIGMQPIYSSELFAYGNNDVSQPNRNVFGYKLPYEEYKRLGNKVTGEVRSGITNSLDIFKFADYYTNAPVISDGFVRENPDFVDRSVAVRSSSQDPFIVEFAFDIKAVRRMPMYNIPGGL